jgi:cyanophycin synthetase
MAELCDGDVTFFSLDPEVAAITQHRAQGKRAVFVRDGLLVLATGDDETPLAKVAAIPLTRAGQDAFQVENVLAATGTAWALGLSLDLIRAGIESFSLDQADEFPAPKPGQRQT